MVALLHAFRPITSPHIWRQVDTLSVSFRYWQRWSLGAPEGLKAFLPAVLNGGDAVGYMPMEFPLLNFMAAPAFAFGTHAGVTLAQLVALGLTLLLLYVNGRVWRGQVVAGVPAARWLLLIPSFSLPVTFFAKFMPDLGAMLLVLLGVGYSWQKPRPVAALLAATLGVLMKPTAAPVMAMMLLGPKSLSRNLRNSLPLVFALGIAFVYYKFGINELKHFQDSVSRFRVESSPPLEGLKEFFGAPSQILQVANDHAFVPWAGIVLLVGAFVGRSRLGRPVLWLLICLFLQTLFLALVSGKHGFMHAYYFMALVPALTLLALQILKAAHNTWITGIFWTLVLGRVFDTASNDLAGYLTEDSSYTLFQECQELKSQTRDWPWDQQKAFRSNPAPYPMLGLCFGERQESKTSHYGFFYADQPLPPGCHEQLTSRHVVLGTCS